MPYDTSTTILGPENGSANAFINWASSKGSARLDDVRQYVETIYNIAPTIGMRPEVLVAQAVLEASEGGIPWNSFWWKERCNCIGNGITGDPVQDQASRDFQNGRNIALCHMVHDWLYAVGTNLPAALEPHKFQDPRWDPAVNAGHAGMAPTLRGFTGRYAMDPLYAEKWVDRLNALEDQGIIRRPIDGDGPQPVPQPVDHGLKAVRFVGLTTPVWLPEDIEVIVDIVPASVDQVRSNQKFTGQTMSLYHETGNRTTGANALGERSYLHGGPTKINRKTGKLEKVHVGYNFAVDNVRIIQLTPLDEVTWSAGKPWWNQHTWAVEQAVGEGLDLRRARRNAAALHAGLAVAKGWDVRKSMVQHNEVYGKNCPQIIRESGLWESVVELAVEFAQRAQVANLGGELVNRGEVLAQAMSIEAPSFISQLEFTGAIPALVEHDGSTFLHVPGLVEATQETPRFKFGRADSPRTGPNIAAGDQFRVSWVFQSDDGRWYYYTPFATRVLLEHTRRIEDGIVDDGED